MINLLCDRSLEEGYASRLRVIDRPLILTSARALGGRRDQHARKSEPDRAQHAGRPDESFWTGTRSESQAPDKVVQPGDEPVPVGFSARTRPAAAPRVALVLAASLSFAAVAIWLGVRAARSSEAQALPSVAAPASSARLVFTARPDPAQAVANASVPEAAATTGPPTPTEATAPASSAVAATATGGRFDIVVASFRTDARVTSVAAEVAALGLPIRRRVSDGWHQVISGPFTSRTDAETRSNASIAPASPARRLC